MSKAARAYLTVETRSDNFPKGMRQLNRVPVLNVKGWNALLWARLARPMQQPAKSLVQKTAATRPKPSSKAS